MVSQKSHYVFVILVPYFIFTTETYAFGGDYYDDSSNLRSLHKKKVKNDCGGEMQEFLCRMSCPGYDYACESRHCTCVNEHNQHVHKPHAANYRKGALNPPGFVDLTKLNEEVYALKPSLRHHIAHFCPNLKEARSCIRKCMEVGKPAFCGKDHVCYCGHRYNEQVKDEDVDSNSVYTQFKDLYKKYFGDNYRPDYDH